MEYRYLPGKKTPEQWHMELEGKNRDPEEQTGPIYKKGDLQKTTVATVVLPYNRNTSRLVLHVTIA